MSKLTEEARSVVDGGRDAFAPSPEVAARLRERIRRASEASEECRGRDKVAPSSGALVEPAPATSAVFGRAWSTNRGLILLVAAIGLTASVSTSTLMSHRAGSAPVKHLPGPESQPPGSHAPEAPNPEFAIVGARASATEAPPRAVPSANLVEAPALQKKRSALAAATEADSLEAEMLLIGAAQAALKSDARAAVTKNLDEHERRFPRGLLREERLTLRVRLLCAEGRAEEAKRALRALENEHPRSSHIASLRDSCVGEGE